MQAAEASIPAINQHLAELAAIGGADFQSAGPVIYSRPAGVSSAHVNEFLIFQTAIILPGGVGALTWGSTEYHEHVSPPTASPWVSPRGPSGLASHFSATGYSTDTSTETAPTTDRERELKLVRSRLGELSLRESQRAELEVTLTSGLPTTIAESIRQDGVEAVDGLTLVRRPMVVDLFEMSAVPRHAVEAILSRRPGCRSPRSVRQSVSPSGWRALPLRWAVRWQRVA
jgi:hypothetical protein